MQQRLASSFENRGSGSGSGRHRTLRRIGALALLLCAYGLTAGGCSRQGEGERCDHAENGDDDCDEGLQCVTPRGSTVDRCCPPAGAPIDDARCHGSDAPIATGGTAGSSNDTGGSSPGGTSGGTNASGGTDASGGTTGGTDASGGTAGDSAGAGGEAPASAGAAGAAPEASGGTEG